MKKSIILVLIIIPSFLNSQDWSVIPISNDGLKPVLTIDSLDRVHIVYMLEDSPGWVRYAKVIGEDVQISTVSEGYFYGPPDITYDHANNPVIAYHDHDQEDQAVRHFVDGVWVIKDTPDPGHDGWDNALVIDRSGNIHTSSVDPSGFGGAGVEYGFYDGNNWTTVPIGSGSIMYAHATNISLDSKENIFITYYNDQKGELELASNSTGSWVIEAVDQTPESGRFAALFIDEADNVYISYLSGENTFKLAMRLNNTWSNMTIDQLDNVEIGFAGARNLTSISKLGTKIGIAYGDKKVIKFALLDENGMSIDTVLNATNQDFGQIVSFDFDSEGKAFIAYSGNNAYNNSLGNIFLATKNVESTKVVSIPLHQINIFPNPVKAGSIINIQAIDSGNYRLYSSAGLLLAFGDQSTRISIPNHIQTGYYYLQIDEPKGRKKYFAKIFVTPGF